jgi:urease accessory protein
MLHVQPPILAMMQRAFGREACAVKARDGKTLLDRLLQEGCAKVRLPKHGHGFERC